MYGFYGDIVEAAEKALERYDETEELLEYPEVQADKAYYLSVLSKYHALQSIKEKLSALKDALEEEHAFSAMLSDAKSDGERAAIDREISCAKKTASELSAVLSDMLGCKRAEERALCKIKCKEGSSRLGVMLFSLLKGDLSAHGARTEQEKTVTAKEGCVREITFIAEGAGVMTRLLPLTGAHKVYLAQAKSEELCFAVTPLPLAEKPKESDFKIDFFHSHGAGGQNINKVETAVRVTHLPTGLTVVCQDERSQLKNKERALKTIKTRLEDLYDRNEKQRIEADIRAQFSNKKTPVSFHAGKGTFTDTRLKAFSEIPFPLDGEQFTSYLNGLVAL